jgi:hypothetical protein
MNINNPSPVIQSSNVKKQLVNSPGKPYPTQQQISQQNGSQSINNLTNQHSSNNTNNNNQISTPLANMALNNINNTNINNNNNNLSSAIIVNQQNHNSHSQSPLHFNSAQINSNNNNTNNNNNSAFVQQQQQISYIASSPKHNHHQNLASPVNYMGNNYVSGGGQLVGTSGMIGVSTGGGVGVGGGGGGSGTGSGGGDSGSNSNLSYPANFVNYLTSSSTISSPTPSNLPPTSSQGTSIVTNQQQQQQTTTTTTMMSIVNQNQKSATISKSVQTEITTNQMLDSASAIETKNTRIDELLKEKDELSKEMLQLKRDHEKQGFSFKKCLSVNKKLLIEKSTLEKKQARQKCMENRLRLGQFVTQRQGATFVENWVDGSAFNDIMK